MILKIGHRGAAGYKPENTLASFKKALELGVDMVEIDIHQCRSGELVAMHDERVNRTTNGSGYVGKKTLTKLKELDAGQGEKIPTLEEILDLVDRKTKINIDLKVNGIAKEVIDIIDKYVKEKGWFYDDFLVSSFSYYELWQFYRLNKRINLGILVEGMQFDFIIFAKKINAYSLNFHLTTFNRYFIKYFIDKAHGLDLKFLVWTVNKRGDIAKTKSLKVDGIISDYPDRL